MSQAQDELVARASDPNAELSTLHELAQNYPGLRPYVAANPRTYPALLDWLGTLGDADVSAVLAARAQGGPGAAMETARRVRGHDPQATQALPGGLPPIDPTATQAVPVAAVAGAPLTQVPSRPFTQPQQPGQPVPYQQQEVPQQPVQGGPDETLFGVGTPEQEAEQRPSAWLWVLAAVTVVAAVALVVWFLSSSHGGEDSSTPVTARTSASAQQVPGTVPATGATAGASTSPAPTPSASPSATLKAPAPRDAEVMTSFTAPSGNITCALGEDSVSCSINEHSFVPTATSCDNSADKPFTVSVGKESSVSGGCDTAFPTSGAVLSYGASARNDSFACTSSESGIECWSQVTGKGFSLSRSQASATTR